MSIWFDGFEYDQDSEYPFSVYKELIVTTFSVGTVVLTGEIKSNAVRESTISGNNIKTINSSPSIIETRDNQ